MRSPWWLALLVVGALAPAPARALEAVLVAGPFSYPWSLAFVDEGLLVAERTGGLKLVAGDRTLTVAGVPPVAMGGQGGLFDVLPVPGSGTLVLAYAHQEGGLRSLRVATATFRPGTAPRLENLKVIFDLLPRSGTQHHFGGRLALLPDGSLLIATGDRGDGDRAQDPSDGAGKIHRVRLDGSEPSVWSSGHRNIQGLWVDPVTGEVWATEHGPQGGDEVNLIKPGRNYGWPVITYGVNYGSGTKIGEGTAKARMEQPVLYWKPSIAPSGLTRYDGDRYPGWKGSFFSGALAGQGVSRFWLGTPGTRFPKAQVPPAGSPATLAGEEYLLAGVLGRIRDVRTGPDGWIYLTTDDPRGRVYRLVP